MLPYAPQYLTGAPGTACDAERRFFHAATEAYHLYTLVDENRTEHDQVITGFCRYEVTREAYEKTMQSITGEPAWTPPTGLYPKPPTSYRSYGQPSLYGNVAFGEGEEYAKFTGLNATKEHHSSYAVYDIASRAMRLHVYNDARYAHVFRSPMHPNLNYSHYVFPVHNQRTIVNFSTIAKPFTTVRPEDTWTLTNASIPLVQFVQEIVVKTVPNDENKFGIIAGAVLLVLGLYLVLSKRTKRVEPKPVGVAPDPAAKTTGQK